MDALLQSYLFCFGVMKGLHNQNIDGSGAGARSTIMQEWVTDIRDQCTRVRVPMADCLLWGRILGAPKSKLAFR